jgi:CRP-like cAMP-binding protein
MPTKWPAPEVLEGTAVVKKGQLIARAGSEVRAVHLIEDGVVGRFVIVGERTVLDAVRSAGWLLGAVPAMTTGRYEATVTALTTCVLRPIPISAFRRAAENLEVSRWLAEMLAADMFAQNARNVAVAGRSTRSLIEEIFVEFMEAAGRRMDDGGVRLTLQLSVVELAGLVGASREHVARVLAELEGEGCVVRVRGWFVAPAGSPILARIRGRQSKV